MLTKKEKEEAAWKDFMREGQYNRMLHLIDKIDTHPWSRRITQNDAALVAHIRQELLMTANDFYCLRNYVMSTEEKEEGQK